MATATAAPPATRSGWIFSPALDLFAFAAPPLLAGLALAIAGRVGLFHLPTAGFLLAIVLVDVAHVHGTLYRVYLDRSEVLRRPRLYLGTPLAAFLVGVVLHRWLGAAGFWRALAYFAVWHFIRQQVGWVALYRARSGEAADPRRRLDGWLDFATVYVATLYPLIDWHTRLPRPFVWFTEGDFAAGLPREAATYARIVWAVVLAAFVTRQLALFVRGQSVSVGKVIVVLGTAYAWWLGIVASDADFAFTLANVLPHGIPYLVLAIVYGRRRYADEKAPRAALGRWLVGKSILVAYFVLAALALGEEMLWDRWVWHDHLTLFGRGRVLSAAALDWVVPLLALPQVTHYVLDGFVWKARSNPDLARYLRPVR
jgi:hypothetical protein